MLNSVSLLNFSQIFFNGLKEITVKVYVYNDKHFCYNLKEVYEPGHTSGLRDSPYHLYKVGRAAIVGDELHLYVHFYQREGE